jgi:predicted GNAT family acetyltransferase
VVEVHESDAQTTLDATHGLLREHAVENNVLWQILTEQAGQAGYGRYWWATDGDAVLGLAVHFPPRTRVLLSPMARDTAVAFAQTISPPLPGVAATAATAAAFAGSWATRHQVWARPVDAQLLYRLSTATTVPAEAPGAMRPAGPSDRQLLVEWTQASEGARSSSSASRAVDRALDGEEIWLWDDGGPVAMAIANRAVGGVSRVHGVFTPTENRGRGYATALVDCLSRQLVGRGVTCAMQTRLTNPAAHAIYRRIGYEPIDEILAFRWEP